MPIDHNRTTKFWVPAAEILFGSAGLTALTYVGLRLDLNRPRTASLAYLIVIVLLSLRGGLIPAVVLSVIAAVCLEYFFAVPRFSMRIDAPEDVLAVTAFVMTSFVITGLVRRARRLDEAAALKDRLQVIIDTIPAMVWSNLPDGSTEFLNKRFRDYAGITAELGQGSAWMNILHPDDRAGIDWHGALAAGEAFEKEARLRASDGEYRRFLLRFVPLRDPQGSIEKWYAKSVDIEDLRRAEEELRQRETRLRDAQMALAHANRVTTTGQLAASIAHEVSQPIAAAITNANAARRWLDAQPPDLAEVREALGRIIRDGGRASDIIGRIRSLVRKAPPRKDQVDINEVVRQVVALTRAELRSGRTSVQTQLADGLPPVLGDRIQLQQVMLNLILNAVEAMSGSGESERKLLIRTDQEGSDGVFVAVQDSGPGLAPESLDPLFDAFYTTKPSGMGMGLSIAVRLLRRMAVAYGPHQAYPRVLSFTSPSLISWRSRPKRASGAR